MKKQNKYYIGSIILGLIVLIVGVIIPLCLHLNSEPNYKIYKEECRNETLMVGWEDYNTIIEGYPAGYYNNFICRNAILQTYENITPTIYNPGKCEITTIDSNIEIIEIEQNITLSNGSIFNYKKQQINTKSHILIETQRPVFENNEVCEDKKVENITKQIINSDWINNCCSTIDNKFICIEVQEAQKEINSVSMNNDTIYVKSCNSDTKKYKDEVIFIEDINKKWLDENCECKKCTDEDGQHWINDMCKKLEYDFNNKCQEYKCESYIVKQ